MRKLMLAGAGALALWSGAASAAEFVFTGTVQSYTVTQAGDYRIEATGASGGRPAASPDVAVGRGATIGGQVFLDAGTVLSIFVGGAGGDAPNTSQNNSQVGQGAGGGGGGTFVFLGTGSFGTADTLIVAGGGGGAWLDAPGSDATGLTIGTDSGGGAFTISANGGGGGAGVGSTGGGDLRFAGGGGFSPANGALGGKGGFNSLGNGGDGGFGGGGGGGGFASNTGKSGAGGGGGFSGGDGGVGYLASGNRGGGAGTSFIVASATDRSGGTAATTGNGRFTIDFLTSVVSPVPEPATWATMILGFSAIGVAMRRRGATPAARLA